MGRKEQLKRKKNRKWRGEKMKQWMGSKSKEKKEVRGMGGK